MTILFSCLYFKHWCHYFLAFMVSHKPLINPIFILFFPYCYFQHFFYQKFEYIVSRRVCVFRILWDLFFSKFSEFLASVLWCLLGISENSLPLFLHKILFYYCLSFPSGIQIMHMPDCFILYHNSWIPC